MRWGVWFALLVGACGPQDLHDAGAECIAPDGGSAVFCGETGEACCTAIVCLAGACDVHWVCNEGMRVATPIGCSCEVSP